MYSTSQNKRVLCKVNEKKNCSFLQNIEKNLTPKPPLPLLVFGSREKGQCTATSQNVGREINMKRSVKPRFSESAIQYCTVYSTTNF